MTVNEKPPFDPRLSTGWPRIPDSEYTSRYRKIRGIPAHRVIVENRIGMKLPSTAIVHHCNPDDRLSNEGPFVVCQDNAYHQLLETRTRALKECGNANWKKCRKCLQWDDPGNMQSAVVKKPDGSPGWTKYWHYRYKNECVDKGHPAHVRRRPGRLVDHTTRDDPTVFATHQKMAQPDYPERARAMARERKHRARNRSTGTPNRSERPLSPLGSPSLQESA
jgi:hypothetical protein